MLSHHEDTLQHQFTSDVSYNLSYNPFDQEGLVNVSHVNITYPECVHETLKTLLMKGESQFIEFRNSRLIRYEILIDHKITKNVLSIPGKYEKNQKESEKNLVYPVPVLTKLRSSIDF